MSISLSVCLSDPSARPPAYSRPGDAALDLFACLFAPKTLAPGVRWKVRTGVCIAIPSGHVGLIFGRSGLPIDYGVLIHTGVVDETFRGELCVIMFNFGSQEYVVSHRERVGQLLIVPRPEVVVRMVNSIDDLGVTGRGAAGFGSSGR